MNTIRRFASLILLIAILTGQPTPAAQDVRGEARSVMQQLNPINLALDPLIDHAISSGNDALAQRLEQLRSIIQETLFNLNKIITDETITINADAGARLGDLNGYVQDNLAMLNGIANGSMDALNQNATSRINQLGDKAGNLVLALPLPAQPLPNVPEVGYSLVKARTPGAPTPLFITGAGLLRGGTRPRAYILTDDYWTDYHTLRHNGTEVPVFAASMGLIQLQIPESSFPSSSRVERTLVLVLNAGGIFEKSVEPSFPLLLCSGLPKYSVTVTQDAYGQVWDHKLVPHPLADPSGQLYVDSGTDHGTDTRRYLSANAKDEGAGGWNADPESGNRGLKYDLWSGRPGTEHIGSFYDDGKGTIVMYAGRDSSGGGWAKMTGLGIYQRKLVKGQCGATKTTVLAPDYGNPTFLESKPNELLDRCAQLSEGAADQPHLRYHVSVLDEKQKVIDQADLVMGGLKSQLVNGAVVAEVDRYGLVKVTLLCKCLRSQ